MYNKLKKLTLFCKLICLILFFISIIVIDDMFIIALLIIFSFTYALFLNNYKMILISVSLPFIYFFSSDIILFGIFKTLLLVTYLLIFLSILNKKEKRFLLEKIFYSNKNNTKWILKKIYYKDKKILNEIEIGDKNQYLKKQIKKKTLYDMDDVYIFSKIRYYNFYKKKKSIFLNKWSDFDNTLIFISIILCILSIYLRWL